MRRTKSFVTATRHGMFGGVAPAVATELPRRPDGVAVGVNRWELRNVLMGPPVDASQMFPRVGWAQTRR